MKKLFLLGTGVSCLLAGCATIPARQELAPSGGQEIVRTAKRYLPRGAKPPLPKPRDCSDYVRRVYRAHGILLPRMTKDQIHHGRIVKKSQLQPGDLVFFKAASWTAQVSHVGIYVRGGKFLHVSERRRHVSWAELEEPYFRKRYLTARRIID